MGAKIIIKFKEVIEMKKIMTVLAVVALFALCGCKNEEVVSLPKEIVIDRSENVDLSGLNEYKSIKNTALEEVSGIKSVVLYTDAQKDGQEDFLWDDGQNYMLLAEDGDGYFELIPKTYLQLCDFDISYFEKLDTNEHCVLVTIRSGSSYIVKEFKYDAERDAFTEDEAYCAEDINYLLTAQ